MAGGVGPPGAVLGASSPLPLVDLWIGVPLLDFVLAVVVAFLALAARQDLHWHPVHSLSLSEKEVWLQTLAGVTGALLGLTLTAIAVILSTGRGPRVRQLFASSGTKLTHVLTAGLAGLAISTAIYGLILPLPGSTSLTVLTIGVGAFAMLRTARILWVFAYMLRIFTTEAAGI